ncbi:MAG: right-handed parallel beta-helix repeat-containing protein [Chitinophagaceae bacterium]|nr:right-handed parallel beta-helix repeat-containing protein [Chitinophagaceae bacterium]
MKKEHLYSKKWLSFYSLPLCAFFLLSNFIAIPNYGRTYFVSPKGNDLNPGTKGQPFQSWQKLSGLLLPGDTAFIRGGTYYGNAGSQSIFYHLLNISGNSKNAVSIFNYPGEAPVLNLSSINISYPNPTALLIENCNYLHLKGIRITGLKQIRNGTGISRGMELRNASHNLIEQVEIDHLEGYGFIIGENSNENLFLNCDAHHLSDPNTQGGNWSNANGFQCTGGTKARGNIFRGCRAWWISDDGFDLYGVDGDFLFDRCWSFWNGFKPGTFIPVGDGDGFKLGPQSNSHPFKDSVTRILTHCIAAGNRGSGFDQNKGDFRFLLKDNISQSNGSYGFMFDYIHPHRSQQFLGNKSVSDKFPRRGEETNGLGNSWDKNFSQTLYPLNINSLAAKRTREGNLPQPKYITKSLE